MEIEAAVGREEGGPFEIETVELEDPQADEVLVRVVGAGVCHTDMIVRDQLYPTSLPAVRGHEGSGVVAAVGEDVTAVGPSDRVVLCFDYDGTCRDRRDGHPAYCEVFFGHGSAAPARPTARRPSRRTARRSAAASSASRRSPPTPSPPSATSSLSRTGHLLRLRRDRASGRGLRERRDDQAGIAGERAVNAP